MTSELQIVKDIMSEEYSRINDYLMNKDFPFTGIGEEHIDVKTDDECKGAMKTLKFLTKKIREIELVQK